MEHECSLPHSQKAATCVYPEPDTPSPCRHQHLLKIRYNIILRLRPGLPSGFLPSGLPYQNPPLLCTCYMPRLCHSSRFHHSNDVWCAVQILSSALCSFLHSPVTSSLLGTNILLSTPFSNTLSLLSSLNVSDQVSHPYKTTDKIIVPYILIFKFLDSKLEGTRFYTDRGITERVTQIKKKK